MVAATGHPAQGSPPRRRNGGGTTPQQNGHAVNGFKSHSLTSSPDEGRADEWTCSEVGMWLASNGFEQYADEFAGVHKVDGSVLLSLTDSDLREKPLEFTVLGDIKKLSAAIRRLRQAQRSSIEGLENGRFSAEEAVMDTQSHAVPMDATRLKVPKAGVGPIPLEAVAASPSAEPLLREVTMREGGVVRTLPGGAMLLDSQMSYEEHNITLLTREEIIRKVESPDTRWKSLLKLAIAFSYCLGSLLITAFVMVLVHDRVPDMKMYPPLPDIVLDNLPLIPWAFEMCETIGVVLCFIWVLVLFFHKHRVVIARRMFSLVGTVFLLRCITMMITSLSVPGVHLECRAKNHGNLWEKLLQAFHIWSKLGMSIQGVRTCGDYMFSGHTTAITLLNHFITEYTPASWAGLHTMTWVLNLFGVFFILAGHEHYSIDVFVAFYISSRMFLYYHTYAYNHANLTAMDDRMRIWFPLGWFFEAGSIGKVPCEFEFPFSIRGKRKQKKEEEKRVEDKKTEERVEKKDKKKKKN